MLSWNCWLFGRLLPEPGEELVEIITGRAGGSQAWAWFCAKHARYFRVIRFSIWMIVRKQTALTPKVRAIGEASADQYLEQSGPPVGTCSPLPLCLDISTLNLRAFVNKHKLSRNKTAKPKREGLTLACSGEGTWQPNNFLAKMRCANGYWKSRAGTNLP